MIFSLGIEDAGSKTECTHELIQVSSKGDISCAGKATGLGKCQVPFLSVQDEKASIRTSIRSLTVPPDMVWQAKSLFTDQLKEKNVHDGMVADKTGKGNLHFVQRNFEADFQFDILFSHEPTSTVMTTLGLTEAIRDALTTFGSRFEQCTILKLHSRASDIPNFPNHSFPIRLGALDISTLQAWWVCPPPLNMQRMTKSSRIQQLWLDRGRLAEQLVTTSDRAGGSYQLG